MTSPVERMREALQGTGLDGWLMYDFQGLNPHARTVLGIPESVFLTRRFFVFVPREGQPVVLHNHIEGGNWRTLTQDWGADLRPFGSHAELDEALGRVVQGQRVAMEYSPDGAVPYVSRVDAGTLERVRRAGAKDIVSSANLLQGFLKWTPEDLAAHERAVQVLMQAKDDAFRLMHERLQAGQPVTELDAQAVIMEQIAAAGMQAGHPVNVSFGVNAADSHYEPGGDKNATLQAGQCVLIDLWAQEPGRPFADVTWVGYAGSPSDEYQSAWTAVRAGRDAALTLLQDRFDADGWGHLQGWEVDRKVRDSMGEPWATFFLHRTGHDLGVRIHGAGANLDDYETRDTRVLTEGLCVTVEPGTYPAEKAFGIRTEVDVYLSAEGPRITPHIQREPFTLGGPESWDEVRARGYGQ
ncbi:aminopeptidase P family protein [Deinococcus cavernae]|uniref:Aminopeptidase P family protein n=1 Tax=Deinococcus cavernae TaxID=2320857 RepID=A0A418V7X5_9DEIO|nr:M24 family metallopeptidase [Deinococcus cavernae]RJF72203.1 aminopeptidase P family protein [Deinococcus cavernae]